MAEGSVEALAARAVAGVVTEVTLFEDRATAIRSVAVSPGRQQLVLGPLSPLVSEQRLSFAPGGPGQVQVEDARVVRERVPRAVADPAAWSAAAAALEAAEAAATAATQRMARAREHEYRAHVLAQAAAAATPRVLLEDPAPEAWVPAVAELAARYTAARVGAVDAAHAEAEAEAEVARRRADLEALREGRPVWRAWLVLQVVATAAAIEVRYTLPCAVWRPAHAAHVDTTTQRLTWTLRAVCWNATGEDWTGVALVCSTARPGDHGNPPELEDDVLRARRRGELVVEAREQEVQVARAAGSRRSAELPGVDDGGEPRVYRAAGPVELPSTGRPVVVPLDRFTAEAVTTWVTAPELGGVVVRRCTSRNLGGKPLLAGPVELRRDGMWVGRGLLPLVAPGEPLVVGLGSHDGVRVTRRVDVRSETATLTGRKLRTHLVEIRVVHLGDASLRLRVDERIPVSELKEITVSAPRAEPALDGPVDRDGFVRWTLELFPGDTRTLTLEYTIDAASSVHLH